MRSRDVELQMARLREEIEDLHTELLLDDEIAVLTVPCQRVETEPLNDESVLKVSIILGGHS